MWSGQGSGGKPARALARAAGGFALIWGAFAAPAAAQISPGPLAQPHAIPDLDGTLKCTTCHGKRSGAMDQACKSCHREIGSLVERGRGFHARDGKKAKCAACHPDHGGRNFALVGCDRFDSLKTRCLEKWPTDSLPLFDHSRAGWGLKGKHAETKCRDCHTDVVKLDKPFLLKKFQMDSSAALSPRKSGAGWVGLEQACAACHEDPHRNSLGDTCDKCHNIDGWKLPKFAVTPATANGEEWKLPHFNHDSTKYPLTGKHIEVKCAKCHEVERLHPRTNEKGQLVAVYKPVSFKDCVDCHEDVHHGRLKGTCDKCHVTSNFHTIIEKGFDHDNTKYPLRGKHETVKCGDCHDGWPAKVNRPPFATCATCHADPHLGKATLAGKTVDCEACHKLTGFKPATYTVADHQKSKYPLEGKHVDVKCGDCHKSRTPTAPAPGRPVGAAVGVGTAAVVKKAVDMRPAFGKCMDCHPDEHNGQLNTRTDKGACESCHKVAGWTQSTYAISEHAKLRLALEGRHAEIKCGACHATARDGLPPFPATAQLGKAKVMFKIVEIECQACHVDPHDGRFTRGGERGRSAGCASCHDAKHFHPSGYDVAAHAKSLFPLEGAHRAVACVSCHEEMKALPRTSSLIAVKAPGVKMTFITKRDGCVTCHKNVHGDQFANRRDKGACDGCHDAVAFVPASRFDHDKDARFQTKGAHAKVPCAECHKQKSKVPNAVLNYRDVPSKCEACHDNPPCQ